VAGACEEYRVLRKPMKLGPIRLCGTRLAVQLFLVLSTGNHVMVSGDGMTSPAENEVER